MAKDKFIRCHREVNDTSVLESEIDLLVYPFYELTEEVPSLLA